MSVKVRIGVALGPWGDAARFSASVDRLEEMGVDSLWLPELVFGSLVEPFVGMAHALARTSQLKVGTGIAILPGRHPVLVAKQLASLAALAPRRVLPVFGLQPARPEERAMFPVPAGRRGAVFDESLELMRLLLREEKVSFTGQYFTIEDASIGPRPVKPLDIWTAGSAPGALRRAGRLADGWLGSFLTPAEAGAARETIQAAAADAGREIEEDHFGLSLPVVADAGGAGGSGEIPAALIKSVRARRPDVDPAWLFGMGWADTRAKIEQYVAAGLSKFVVRPAGDVATPSGLDEFLDRFATEMIPLQD
jgi:probable F420-dependent oxidoreductase